MTPPSATSEMPLTYLARCDANVTFAANFSGIPTRPAGICFFQFAKTSSGLPPERAEIAAVSESSRPVRASLARTLFTVAPKRVRSVASVFASPVIAAHTELKSSSSSTGCFNADELIVMKPPIAFLHPQLDFPCKMRCAAPEEVNGELPRLGVTSSNDLDGGPPQLVMQMSIRPKRGSTLSYHSGLTARTVSAAAGSCRDQGKHTERGTGAYPIRNASDLP